MYGTGPPFHPVNQIAALANTPAPVHSLPALDDPLLSETDRHVLTHCSRFSGIARQFAEPTAAVGSAN
jgi:hypothetical protein